MTNNRVKITMYEYDKANRVIKQSDADGNMIYGPLNGEMATFTYDCRNRLIETITDSGETTQYVYDAENVRTKVIKNAGTKKETVTTYVTDNVSHELSRVLEATTTDKAGNTETIRYTYGNGLVAQEKGKEYLLYHFNHLGSTTAVTDEAGEIKYTYTYNIFGKLLSGNYGEVEFLYNGQYGVASDANGLYYMRARYYNIDIMRFINQDILTGSIDSSQSLNRYAYVEGNPVNFLDPFGLDETSTDNCILHLWHVTKEGIVQVITGGGTISTGYSISGAFGVAGSASFALTMDGKGNLAFQFAPAAGGGMPSAAISKYYSYSNAPSIKVADLTAQMGGSIDVGPSVGFDLLAILNDDKSQSGYVGGALYVGLGLAPYAVEGHGTVSKSYDIFKINLLED